MAKCYQDFLGYNSKILNNISFIIDINSFENSKKVNMVGIWFSRNYVKWEYIIKNELGIITTGTIWNKFSDELTKIYCKNKLPRKQYGEIINFYIRVDER